MSKTVMQNMLDSIPESNIIRDKAIELDEKDFDTWWWETIYKDKNHVKIEKQQIIDAYIEGYSAPENRGDSEQYYNLKFKDNEK